MTEPRVLNFANVGFEAFENGTAVYVGRPSKWGNPFRVHRHATREIVIKRYESYLQHNPMLLAELSELRGKDLVCHCAPKPCHADVLLRLANKSPLFKRITGAF